MKRGRPSGRPFLIGCAEHGVCCRVDFRNRPGSGRYRSSPRQLTAQPSCRHSCGLNVKALAAPGLLVPLCEHLPNCVDNEARLVEWNIF
jgi:hypothetical protein